MILFLFFSKKKIITKKLNKWFVADFVEYTNQEHFQVVEVVKRVKNCI
jgi:hypothetical protein